MNMLITSEAKMKQLGVSIAKCLISPLVMELEGPLGVGKTTLVRSMLSSLGYTGLVKSPTYTLIEAYDFPSFQLYHLDLYRLKSAEELAFIGLSDYLIGQSIFFIEWPERGQGFLPTADIRCRLQFKEDKREVEWLALTKRGEEFLHCLNVQ